MTSPMTHDGVAEPPRLPDKVDDTGHTVAVAASIEALVEPDLLIWARTTANYEPIAADRKIKVPEGRVAEWEAGDRRPTIAELRRAADVYNRPLGTFFLPQPPREFDTMRDFRRLEGGQMSEWSAALHAEYRRAHTQREALLEIAELDDAEPAEDWRLTGIDDRDGRNSSRARRLLREISPLPFPRPSGSEYDHLNYWTAGLEQSGVLVMSTEGGRVSTDEMRAFSLYFDHIPVIMLNGADWPRGRLFSLIHEYAHLLLHTSGICDTTTQRGHRSEDRELEARCNAIAARILMPRRLVMKSEILLDHEEDTAWSVSELAQFARPFGVSAESMLRRLATLNVVSVAEYRAFRRAQKKDDMGGATRPSGGNFYNTKARDLGKGYVRTVGDAHRRTLIDSTTAATFLDVKVDQMAKLIHKAAI